MRALWAALAGLVVLAGCDTPLTARGEAVQEISASLGDPVMPLEGGIYRFDRSSAPQEDTVAAAFDAVVGGEAAPESGARPLFTDLFVLQRHAASQSYVTSYGNVRFHRFDGDVLVIDTSADVNETIYFLARVQGEGRELIIYEYNCTAFDEATRERIGLEDQCRIRDIETLRAGLAALDTDALPGLRFEWTQALPDRE